MTTWPAISLLGWLAVPAVPQAVDLEKWNTVERMCGKVEWLEAIPGKGKLAEFEEHSKPIQKTEIRLSRREKESARGSPAVPVARVVTGKVAVSNFKNLVPGNDSVLVGMGGKQYSYGINYVASKDEGSCSDSFCDKEER